MNQQINLFQPIFRKQRKVLSFEALLQISAIVLVALITLQAVEQWQQRGLQATLATLQTQQGQRLALLEQLTSQYSQSGKETPQAQLSRLQAELEAQQFLIGKLSRTQGAGTQGFSRHMEAFARQIINGMWLTGFRITDGGSGLVVRGSSLEPGLIPGFLERLGREQAIAGTRFNLLQMQRETGGPHQVDFTLYTDPGMDLGPATGGAQ